MIVAIVMEGSEQQFHSMLLTCSCWPLPNTSSPCSVHVVVCTALVPAVQ